MLHCPPLRPTDGWIINSNWLHNWPILCTRTVFYDLVLWKLSISLRHSHPDDVIHWHPDGPEAACLSFVMAGPWSRPVSNFLCPRSWHQGSHVPVCHVGSSFSHMCCGKYLHVYRRGLYLTSVPVSHLHQSSPLDVGAENSSIMTRRDMASGATRLATAHRQTFDCKNELAQNKTYFCNMSVWCVYTFIDSQLLAKLYI